jgi:hypothetical protein
MSNQKVVKRKKRTGREGFLPLSILPMRSLKLRNLYFCTSIVPRSLSKYRALGVRDAG